MVISIFKFLSGYYGVSMDAGKKLTHAEAKRNFNLKGCPFDYAAGNPDLVGSGKIIYVKDTSGTTLPYICPEIVKVSEHDCGYTEEKKKPKNKSGEKDILTELSDLPTYVVHELLSRYKYQPSFYKVIKRELIKRGVYKNKEYKLRKENLELERGGYNDKYQRRRKIKCKKS